MRLDEQPPETALPFGVLRLEVPPGPHSLLVSREGLPVFSHLLDTAAAERWLVPTALDRTCVVQRIRFKIDGTITFMDRRAVHFYKWGAQEGPLETLAPSCPLKVAVDFGLTQTMPLDLRHIPEEHGLVFSKLHRAIPDALSEAECYAVVDYARNAYMNRDRLKVLGRMAGLPVTAGWANAVVQAAAKRYYVPRSLVDRLCAEYAGDLTDQLPVDPDAYSGNDTLVQILVRFATTERLVALYKTEKTTGRTRGSILNHARNQGWEKGRAVGVLGLDEKDRTRRQYAILCLLHPQALDDAELMERIRASLGTGPKWAKARRAYEDFMSRSLTQQDSPEALEALKAALHNEDPTFASDAAGNIVDCDKENMTALLIRELPAMGEKAKRFLLLRWRDKPWPCSPRRASILMALLQSKEELLYEHAADALLKKDYFVLSEVRKALDAFLQNPPELADWKFTLIRGKVERAKKALARDEAARRAR
ncbi:MAG: hypothetical protein JXR37_26725 [Kiritimatiellae bacterium]|nr:hypothetical protein [Kiritimatiellia bacterium]